MSHTTGYVETLARDAAQSERYYLAFDAVICWQTLSWLDDPKSGVRELIRIARPGGTMLASSLFNPDFDVDIQAHVFDRTRESSAIGLSYSYNTSSLPTAAGFRRGVAELGNPEHPQELLSQQTRYHASATRDDNEHRRF